MLLRTISYYYYDNTILEEEETVFPLSFDHTPATATGGGGGGGAAVAATRSNLSDSVYCLQFRQILILYDMI